MQQQPTYVGLDLHKSTIVATALDTCRANGSIRRS